MRSIVLCVALAVVMTVRAEQPPTPKIQALIITGQHGHDWRATTPLLRQILEATDRFEVRVTEEFRGAAAETLTPYDLVILNYFDGNRPERRWGERAEAALVNFVRSGKGLVVYHFAVAAFGSWDEYEPICAGNWRPDHGHHSARHDFTVELNDKDHPITRGMAASFPQPNDELYANLKWHDEGTFHLLASAWDDHALYDGKARQPIPGPGKHEPMLWTVNYGQGRVFATVLGHDPDAMHSPGFVSTLARGAEWAATGTVTIPLPPELRK